MRKNIKDLILFGTCLSALFVTPAFAENAPVATHTETVSISKPVRVWVLPGNVGGMHVTGHYEYFHIQVPESRQIPDGIPTEPAIK